MAQARERGPVPNLVFGAIYTFTGATGSLNREGPLYTHDFWHWEVFRRPMTQNVQYASSLREMMGMKNRSPRNVLFLQRGFDDRFVVDARTQSFGGIVKAFCDLGVPVAYALFGSEVPFKDQYMAFAAATVLVAVHGAGLTNIPFLSSDSAVVEVTLRYGWCKDPVPDECLLGHWADSCTTVCRENYHKADYPNSAHSYGLKYFYFDPDYVDQYYWTNPIFVHRVHVNATALALISSVAHRMAISLKEREMWTERLNALASTRK